MQLNYIRNIQLAFFFLSFFICFDSKSVLCAFKNLDCKMRGDILYDWVKYLIPCIMYGVLGLSFVGYRFIVVFIGMKYQIINKVQWKTCLKHHTVTSYYYRLMRLFQYLRRTCINKLKKKLICDTFLFEVFSESNLQVTSKYMEH